MTAIAADRLGRMREVALLVKEKSPTGALPGFGLLRRPRYLTMRIGFPSRWTAQVVESLTLPS